MRPKRKAAKRTYNPVESSDDDCEQPAKKKSPKQLPQLNLSEDSSSDSDIGNYLRTPSKLDLDSSFFNPDTKTNEDQPMETSEQPKKVMFDLDRLSDSGSNSGSSKSNKITEEIPISTMDFEHINTYNKKLEEARKFIEVYKAKKAQEEKPDEVSDILKLGEGINDEEEEYFNSLGSSDFETASDSDKEDWEVVAVKDDKVEEKRGVEITITAPTNVKKKKGVDLMAIVKRRINRVKKENQVYVHKVHLLTWIAHGLFVNNVLNDQYLLGLGLSLLPSQHCLPKSRLDITYLENIVGWYRKMMGNKELPMSRVPKKRLVKSLEEQILNKEAYNHKFLVYIFIIILRSLGFDCRLVLSLQVERLTPNDLLSVSNKKDPPKPNPNKVSTQETPKSVKVLSSKLNSIKSVGKKLKDKLNLSKIGKFSLDEPSTSKKGKSDKKPAPKKSGNGEKPESRPTNGKTRTENKLEKEGKVKNNNDEVAKDTRKLGRTKKLSKDGIVADEDNESATTKCRKKETGKVNNKMEPRPSTSKDGTNTEETKSSHERGEKSLGTKTDSKGKSRKTQSKNKKELPKTQTNENSKDDFEKEEVIESSENKKETIVKSAKPGKEVVQKDRRKLDALLNLQQQELDKLKVNKTNISKKLANKATLKKTVTAENSEVKTNPKTTQKQPTFKVKLQLKKKSNQPPEEEHLSESEEEIQRNFQPLLPIQEIIPKIEVTTPKKSSFCSEDGFLGFDLSESRPIPQFDGANDSDSTPKSNRTKPNLSKSNRTKPNLSKLKPTTPEKCKVKSLGKRLRQVPKYTEIDSDEDFSPKSNFPKRNINLKKLSSKPSTSTNSSSDSDRSRFFSTPKGLDVRNDIMSLVQRSISEEKVARRGKLVKRKSNSNEDDLPSEVDRKKLKMGDFKEKVQTKVKRRIPTRKELLELEEKKKTEREAKRNDKGINVWIEVFAEAEEKWISVDVDKGQVHCVKEIFTRATHPISYILAIDNNNHIKDITKRYCSTIWNTSTRRLRVDDKWWNSTLKPYQGPQTPRCREEDEDLAKLQLEQPLPTTISEYKNHPLYVLKRHLLKFEAIYPPDSLTLGFVRNEPVYSRDCVYTLHSREIWMKHAKVVKPGETPYKIVKARPKYDKLSNTLITDLPLEVFGEWQIEDFVPPTAENGVVPRNAYGNVELFKACMLPKGTVHLQLPGLNKVARKLNIDCASAVTGFDFHSGWNHPTYDGFVVCEEFSEILVAAWFEDQQEAEKRAQEKIEKRVYDNWKKLIRGLLIRERLKIKYNFGAPSTSGKPEKKNKKTDKPSTSRTK